MIMWSGLRIRIETGGHFDKLRPERQSQPTYGVNVAVVVP